MTHYTATFNSRTAANDFRRGMTNNGNPCAPVRSVPAGFRTQCETNDEPEMVRMVRGALATDPMATAHVYVNGTGRDVFPVGG